MTTTTPPHFTRDEYARRLDAACAAVTAARLDGVLLFKQESMYWLTGYDTFGYCFFQCLMLRVDGRMALLTRAADLPNPKSPETVPMQTLIPAFMLSELRAAFIIGFVVFVPFLVIDLVVSAALMSMGMMMLPPVMISLPFKLLLFVLVDGWGLIVTALVGSYTVG